MPPLSLESIAAGLTAGTVILIENHKFNKGTFLRVRKPASVPP